MELLTKVYEFNLSRNQHKVGWFNIRVHDTCNMQREKFVSITNRLI